MTTFGQIGSIGDSAAYIDIPDPYRVFHGGGKGKLSPHRTYGSALPMAPLPSKVFQHGSRRRLNVVAILISLFLPWLFFCAVHSLLSGKLRFRTPMVMYTLLGVSVAMLIGLALLSFRELRKKAAEAPDKVPTWFTFLFLTTLLAFVLALVSGHNNYENCTRPYYQLELMNHFQEVDPSETPGKQLMDAGSIDFVRNASLNLSMAMSFKNLDVYCVVPITNGFPRTGQFDYWAVGKNCCSPDQSHVWCEDFKDPWAQGALRLLDDKNRAFYRLAVQQAEAFFHVRAEHPLFFTWVVDTSSGLARYIQESWTRFLLGIGGYFVLQFFLVAAATIFFSKLE
eukprot:CAMPEP_0178410200 /NCGR_PEP_ID=MMETSP0689_2-20121128/20856_1 /TAXON_ID=160604 /ORGANISM="Amphidinium massartii, Strain CS-259" /LENGTH=338 /DNA_ID=CAMNT_0020031367 /DNA_START=55 /DNA_END=1071 /DNA_ORIENTATION=+